jgi:protein-disulfide isomerase
MDEENVTIGKDLIYGVAIAVLVALFVISVVTGGFGLLNADNAQNCTVPAAPAQPAPAAPSAPSNGGIPGDMIELMDDDMKMGLDSAPVIIVEWSDLQCPFCRKFWTESFSQLKTDYIDTGEVQYVFRDFPLGFHAAAQKAAESTECADEQGKGWEFHDKVYSEQNKQGVNAGEFTVSDMKGWAKDIGLDSVKFDACLDSGKYASEVAKDMSDGQAAGIQGTPGFIVGKRDGSSVKSISGAQPYSVFKSTIDSLLQ